MFYKNFCIFNRIPAISKRLVSLLTNGLQLLKSSQSGYFCAAGVHLLRKKISLLEIDGILLKIQENLLNIICLSIRNTCLIKISRVWLEK